MSTENRKHIILFIMANYLGCKLYLPIIIPNTRTVSYTFVLMSGKLTLKEGDRMDQAKIGKFISELRKEKNLTQEQLAEKIGVTQKSVSRWETGKNMPDISILQPLAAELGVTVSELLDGVKSESNEKSADEAIYQIIDYSLKSKAKRVFNNKEVNFITAVIAALIIVLLIIGAFMNMETIPLVILGLLSIIIVFRLIFGRCPSCGKLLPLFSFKMKTCPFCGIKLK